MAPRVVVAPAALTAVALDRATAKTRLRALRALAQRGTVCDRTFTCSVVSVDACAAPVAAALFGPQATPDASGAIWGAMRNDGGDEAAVVPACVVPLDANNDGSEEQCVVLAPRRATESGTNAQRAVVAPDPGPRPHNVLYRRLWAAELSAVDLTPCTALLEVAGVAADALRSDMVAAAESSHRDVRIVTVPWSAACSGGGDDNNDDGGGGEDANTSSSSRRAKAQLRVVLPRDGKSYSPVYRCAKALYSGALRSGALAVGLCERDTLRRQVGLATYPDGFGSCRVATAVAVGRLPPSARAVGATVGRVASDRAVPALLPGALPRLIEPAIGTVAAAWSHRADGHVRVRMALAPSDAADVAVGTRLGVADATGAVYVVSVVDVAVFSSNGDAPADASCVSW